MRSGNNASGWKEERTGVEFVDMLKLRGRVAAHQAYIPGKTRPHQVMELLAPQMPIGVGLQSSEE